MKSAPTLCREVVPAPETLAIHLLHALTMAQRAGTRLQLDELCTVVGARRRDVRSSLSSLHRQGFVDVLRMRLTLAGFAIGQALVGRRLAPLRIVSETRAA